MSGSGHDYGGWNCSKVIGSERSPADMGAYKFPLRKCSIFLPCHIHHTIPPFYSNHLRHSSLHFILKSSKLADLLDIVIVLIVGDDPSKLFPTAFDNSHHNSMQLVKEFIETPELQKLLPKFEYYKFITVFPNYKETLTISILRITAPIAFIIDIAKELSNAGIIEKEKRLRAIVSVARPNSGTVVRSFGGTKTDTWLFYSITLNNNL